MSFDFIFFQFFLPQIHQINGLYYPIIIFISLGTTDVTDYYGEKFKGIT